jgi:hypothetical protein
MESFMVGFVAKPTLSESTDAGRDLIKGLATLQRESVPVSGNLVIGYFPTDN